jgi:hypothetical protein
MINPYKIYLDGFFENLLYFRHISGRIDKVFHKEVKDYSKDKNIISFTSALVISDWTKPTDNGWEVNFHTGIVTHTSKDNYELEVRKIFSKQLCLLYAQSFEAFERFVKDCLFDKIERDESIREYTISLLPKNQQSSIVRGKMPGGGNLFKVLKKGGGETFKNFTEKNNLNIKFSELWTILSEARHSITHMESEIKFELINKTKHHGEIFEFLFNSNQISSNLISIELDYQKFERLIKRFSEFAYQIFKVLSVEEELEWESNN